MKIFIYFILMALYFQACGQITYEDNENNNNSILPSSVDNENNNTSVLSSSTTNDRDNISLEPSTTPESMIEMEWKKSYKRIFREYTVIDKKGYLYSLYRVDQPHRAIISKVDLNGTIIWEKTITLNQKLQASYIYNGEMKLDAEGNIYLVGSGSHTVNNTGFSNRDYFQKSFVMKFSPLGDKLWEYINDSKIRTYGEALSIDAMGNVYFVGRDENQKLSLIKLDKYGNKVMNKFYDSVSYNNFGIPDIILSNNSLYLLMTKKISKKKIMYIVKTSLTGTKEWAKAYVVGNTEYLDHIGFLEDSFENIIIVSNTYDSKHKWLPNISLLKINKNGSKIWEYTYGTEKSDKIRSIAIDKRDNIFITGYTSGAFNGYENDKRLDIFLSKISSQGDILKTEQIKTFSLGGNVVGGRFIGFDNKQNLFLAGYGVLGSDMSKSSFLIKYKSQID